ncbi:MAG: nitroreductase family protein [Chloroflexi bacterium]|nr:nitroreductase family protein [Chloroflexota bacterium]
MDAYQCIVTKRDSRSYAEMPIEEDALRRILQAGRMAGSSKNTQPCRFVVLRDAERKAELAACGQFAQHVPQAAAAIAVCLPPTGGQFDAGRAAQNMMLAAWNEGVASCPVSMHDQEGARQTLGLPEGWRVAIVLALGYPRPGIPLGRGERRLALEEFVRWERWS